ncbi:MAG: hypothetical protein KKD63_16630 [Proteobacteria bacterium]|nr:hypothetical protein [Pseudomonadota bacterium]
MNDFSTYKFRVSSLPALMTNSRVKSDPLSETAKEMIRKCYIQEVYSREDFIQTAPMTKGIMVESDILDLLQTVTKETYFKNKTRFENDYVRGTPDISAAKDRVIDTKASWTIWTFAAVTEDKAKKDYFWQIAGYAELLKKIKGELVFGLVNTPEELILKELYKANADEAREEQIRKNHTYDDIAPEKKLKRYTFDFTPEDFQAIKERVGAARVYMGGLDL